MEVDSTREVVKSGRLENKIYSGIVRLQASKKRILGYTGFLLLANNLGYPFKAVLVFPDLSFPFIFSYFHRIWKFIYSLYF